MKLTGEQRGWLACAQREWAEVRRPGAERIGTHLFGEPISLLDDAMCQARLFASRDAVLSALPKDGRVAESSASGRALRAADPQGD